MQRYSIEPRTRKYVKGYGFLSFPRKYKRKIIGYRTRCFTKVVHKAGKYLGNKIADVVTNSNDDVIEKQEPVVEITIQPEKKVKY